MLKIQQLWKTIQSRSAIQQLSLLKERNYINYLVGKLGISVI